MGAIYTLTAKGLFVAHLATHRLNFGQGDFLMVGAYLTMALVIMGAPAPLALLVVMVVLGVLGYGLERAAIRPLRLHIVTAGPGDTVQSLAARMTAEDRAIERFLALNGLERSAAVKAGEQYKITAE